LNFPDIGVRSKDISIKQQFIFEGLIFDYRVYVGDYHRLWRDRPPNRRRPCGCFLDRLCRDGVVVTISLGTRCQGGVYGRKFYRSGDVTKVLVEMVTVVDFC